MAPSTRFWDKIAERYAKQPIADEAAYEKKLEVTRAYFRPDMKVLEIGCGTGGTAIAHAPYVKQLHATDLSPKMIEIAQRNAADRQVDNVSFSVASVEALNVPDGSFDAVLGLSVLHLLDDKDAAIGKIYRMLKPGGVFVSNTACIADSMRWFKLVAPVGALFGLIPRVDIFTTQALVTSLNQAGFTIEHQWQSGKGKAVFIVAKRP
ncbi:MAG: methyltransferase domain-containing protein [Pseudomonadota bacterium]